jgi:hypothetical protein
MDPAPFDKDAMAKWYARQHLQTDPGIVEIYYLPKGASDREIRFVEVNQLIAEMNDDALEPLDFGVDTGSESEHKLFVLDVTPSQWDAIKQGDLALPWGWILENAIVFPKKKKRR